MLSRNPVRNTTRDYPWAKVFFGFVGGMLLLNEIKQLLEHIYVVYVLFTQFAGHLTDINEITQQQLFEPLFSVSRWMASIATAEILVWKHSVCNKKGIGIAIKYMVTFIAIWELYTNTSGLIHALKSIEFKTIAKIYSYVFLSSLKEIVAQGAFAALLASWLLPKAELTPEDAPVNNYPWRLLLIAFLPLVFWEGPISAMFYIFSKEDFPKIYFFENVDNFIYLGLFIGTWLAWCRPYCNIKGIAHVLLISIFPTMLIMRLQHIVWYDNYTLVAILSRVIAVLLLAILVFPYQDGKRPSVKKCLLTMLIGGVVAVLITVASYFIVMPEMALLFICK